MIIECVAANRYTGCVSPSSAPATGAAGSTCDTGIFSVSFFSSSWIRSRLNLAPTVPKFISGMATKREEKLLPYACSRQTIA
ncbi:unnamed protein product [Onchocerca ochengi]|uniref:Uncharacterized protein n=1 Tax=Onchocerca ochengi TaxID=42157 RepID=A0A182E2I2_ONCOC|nr:unnamed protein product [Onchocerca ochengi]